MLTYNLKAILLSEKFKTVDIDKVPSIRKGYSRDILDPIAANPFAGSGKAKMDYEDVKIKKGQKGYKKRKYTKKGDYWEKPIKTATPKTDPGMKSDVSTSAAPSKPAPEIRTTNLPVPVKAPKDPDIVDAEFEEVPDAPKQLPAGAEAKKKKKQKFGPEVMYSAQGPEYSFFMPYDPNRFKKIAIQKARGYANEKFVPKLKDIIR